jgi:hypothetical protein
MANQITVRGVPKELAKRLAKLAESNGTSVNSMVLNLLQKATGVAGRRERLARYTTWSAEDAREFNEALRSQRKIDAELWK